jgi:hypothetical protein
MNAQKEFFESVPEERRSVFKKLDSHIRKHAPDLTPYTEGKFLGYGKYHYKYDSGREGEWFTIGLRNNKDSIAVYVTTTVDDSYLTEKYEDQLNADIGKSCIRFKKEEDIDWTTLGELFEEANKLYLR